MSLVTTSLDDRGVIQVTLDDPERYNALSSTMVGDLKSAFADIRTDRDVRAVIVAGAGRGFCSGANMGGGDDVPERARDRGPVGLVQMFQEHIAELMLAVHELPQPVIAAVHGAAVGGGLALALACDLRVASTDAFFASHFIRVGLSSCDVGTSYLLPRIIGATRAAELMLTGRRFSAEEADRFGMLNRLVPRDELLAAAHELAASGDREQRVRRVHDEARASGPTSTRRACAAAMELENRTQVLGTFTGNMTEAGEAFREKRDPVWKPM